jgi:hypothetical protein
MKWKGVEVIGVSGGQMARGEKGGDKVMWRLYKHVITEIVEVFLVPNCFWAYIPP